MEKRNNSLTIVLVCLILIALVGGFFLGKNSSTINTETNTNNNENVEKTETDVNDNGGEVDNTEANTNENKGVVETNNANKQVVKTVEKNYLVYYDIFSNKKLFDVYSMSANEGSYMIFKYNNKMYMVDSSEMTNAFYCAAKFVNSNGSLSNGIYSCKYDGRYSSDNVTVRELNLSSSDVTKVITFDYPYSSDAQFSVFFINSNDKVDYYHFGEGGSLRTDVLSDYKVKDIKYTCTEEGDGFCKKAQLNLTLQDNKTVNVDNFDWK